MTPTTDIEDVKARLTVLARTFERGGDTSHLSSDLKSLLTALSEAEKERANARAALLLQAKEIRRLMRQDGSFWFARIESYKAEVTRLRSLVDEAAGVLEPFGKTWAELTDPLPQGPFCLAVEAMHCCAAASFLTRLRAQPNTAKPAIGREPEGN